MTAIEHIKVAQQARLVNEDGEPVTIDLSPALRRDQIDSLQTEVIPRNSNATSVIVPVPVIIKYLWAAPCTAIGACLGAVMMCAGAKVRLRAGVAEVAFSNSSNYGAQALQTLPFAGITFGHVVLACTEQEQARIRVHERAHVTQYEKWGPLFFVLYLASSLVQILRGCHAYRDNHFEVQARAVEREHEYAASAIW